MKPVYVFTLAEATLHISKGNSKIGKGIYSFSTLPGNKDHLLVLKNSALLTTVHGTCSKFCDACFNGGCYAVNSAKLHNNVVIKAWGENTLLLRAGRALKMVDEFITLKNARYAKTHNPDKAVVKMWRWNVSGEIENLSQLEEMNQIAINHPEVKFGIYTKNFDVLEEFMLKHEDTAPNFCINVSQWHGVADAFLAKHPNKFNIFEYDDSNLKTCTMSEKEKARLAKTPHCKAVTKEGKHAKKPDGKPITCDGCTHCYTKHPGYVQAVYSH